ncbi:MAG: PEGA domain-containing protein [Myxococcales bacterium]|nr:PEGA domain-containing protein [Myxococcales bacterium]
MRRTTLSALTAVSVVAPLILSPALRALAQAPAPAGSTAPSASGSAGADDAKKKEEAKEHFVKGLQLFQEEAWDAALAEFTVSMSLYPTRNAMKNAAVCLRQLGRFDEALTMYENLLKQFAGQIPPQDLETVNKAVTDLRGLTGTIEIESNVTGATVVIDGKERGKTPLAAPVIVSAGTRIVRVSKEGYVPFEAKPIIAGKGALKLQANLEALARSGRIKVSEVGGTVMTVIVDGAEVGKTPYEGVLAPGSHWVALRGEGKQGTQPAAANVQLDQTITLSLKAEELGGEARIETEPPGALVVLDGVPVGQGIWEGRLRLGTHKLDVSAEGYFGTAKTFEVGEKKATTKITLDRDDNSPFWAKGRKRPISIALFGGGLFGLFGQGSDQDRSCSSGSNQYGPVTCNDRSKPLGFQAGARAGYEVAPGLAIELDLGYAFFGSKVARNVKLPGEFNTTVVDVTASDTTTVRGVTVGLGVSYTFFKKPFILAGAFSFGGIVGAKVFMKRDGSAACVDQIKKPDGALVPNGRNDCATAVVRDDPKERPMGAASDVQTKSFIPFVVPELRVAFPINESMQIGLGLGAMVGLSSQVVPTKNLRQTPTNGPNDFTPDAAGNKVYGQPVTPDGKTIGFITSSESWLGTFVLPRATLFYRVAF